LQHHDQVEVVVRDDGAGFDTQAQTSSAYGLVGMRFRVEAQGGTLKVTSAPGRGTEIHVRLPSAHDAGAGSDTRHL
jgi:signal transduction histidine kinase